MDMTGPPAVSRSDIALRRADAERLYNTLTPLFATVFCVAALLRRTARRCIGAGSYPGRIAVLAPLSWGEAVLRRL